MAKLPIAVYAHLIGAGYTPDEISEYAAGLVPDPAPAPAPQPDPVPAPAPQPDPVPAPAPQPDPAQGELLTEMRSLLAMMRNTNIHNVTMPTETAPDAAQIAATILAPQPRKEN